LNTCDWEDGSVVCSCCWSRQHSHSQVRVPRDSRPKIYCLGFETLPTCRARSPYLYPPGTVYPFHRLLQLAGLRWRYSTPPSQGIHFIDFWLPEPVFIKFGMYVYRLSWHLSPSQRRTS
jgi:hypothetical protein